MGSKDITPRLSESPRRAGPVHCGPFLAPSSKQLVVALVTVVLLHIQVRGSIPRKFSIQLMTSLLRATSSYAGAYGVTVDLANLTKLRSNHDTVYMAIY
jgi:hypothetical protein